LKPGRYKPQTQRILVICLAVVVVMALIGATILYPGSLGPKQPIPFSHRVHAGQKEIGCLMCHPYPTTRAVAGIPPEETCMLCHIRIIIHYPAIEDLQDYYKKGEPIRWTRVSNLVDFVHFNHGVHLAAGVDCGHCHGDVKAMDRIVLYQSFNMGFCISCHREYNATHDCFACHY
jgi:hypothetical protein